MKNLAEALASAGTAIADRLVSYLPSLIGATLLLLAGWLLARILRVLAVRTVRLGDTLIGRLGAFAGGTRTRTHRAAEIFGTLVFWAVLLVFVTAATQVLELHSFTDWLARLVGYLPTLAVGAVIVVAGYMLSRFVADIVRATATRIDPPQRALLARVAQSTIFVGAMLVGADQIGIKITFLAIFLGGVMALVGGAVAVAVGLGAREHVANLIGAQQMRQAFGLGQRVRIGEHEGRILEIRSGSMVLECAEGRVNLPGRLYSEAPITVFGGNEHD